jgi:KipI family sensor histidine kinase inhibitor
MADWVPLGDRAIRFTRPSRPEARAIVRTIRAWPGVIDVVVARSDVAVYFADAPHLDAGLIEALASARDDDVPAREIELQARYDGPDLDEVSRACGMTVEAVIALHAERTYEVETIGFAPGFAYLSGLEARLAQIPRRATPRPRVAAGSLAIAGGYTAVYPFASPGGWHLIGSVREPMFDHDGARLRLGDRVRFVR